MPAKKRPGVTGVYVELPDEDVAALDALTERLPLGSKADHIRLAVRRHLANPPTVIVAESPPIALPAVPPASTKPRGRPRKKG